MSEQNKRLDRIENDVRELAKMTNENTIAIKELTVTLKSFLENSVKNIKDTLDDHEDRIRNNTKFVYQAAAVISVTSVVIGYALRLVR